MIKAIRCVSCGKESITISGSLGLCADCIKCDFPKWEAHLAEIHAGVRMRDGLPPEVPRSEHGITCRVCGNQCTLGNGEIGYCGLRKAIGDGRLNFIAGSASRGKVSWYLDPLPTNCVADWVCAGRSQYGFYNLAVFYEACSFDCLFCQNWHYRTRRSRLRSAQDLIRDVSDKVSCICFFGGDPGPQVIHALAVSRTARRKQAGKILRICWETNGNISPKYLDSMVSESLETGGTIKVDIKAWSDPMSLALCGISNRRTLEVARSLLETSKERMMPPLFVASTLLVPGYVDEEEVKAIAEFIAGIDRDTPYSLLGFTPCFWMSDMPATSVAHAERCARVAREAGLTRVRIGNRHVLGRDY